MSTKTGIEWTDATWNPVTGCSKVSQGCRHCYAERDWARLSAPRPQPNIYTGRAFTDVQCHPERFEQPLHWTRPRRIFVNSMSDLFHPMVEPTTIRLVFNTMLRASHHTFQVLTKRPRRMRDMLANWDEWRRNTPTNIWLGVSVEDQETADERIPLLLDTPAAVRWISAEPLLGPITVFSLDGPVDVQQGVTSPLHQVIVGGESGPKARPMHPAWARSLRDQCAEAGVPFLFKQWGEWVPRSACYHTFEDGRCCSDMDPSCTRWPNVIRITESGGDGSRIEDVDGGNDAYMQRVGKKSAGRLLDGRLHDEYPKGAA